MGNISAALENDLCLSCGMCVGTCPQKCIYLPREYTKNGPVIDAKKCVDCGICSQICPGLSSNTSLDHTDNLNKCLVGPMLATYNGWAKNDEIRKNSTSGGITTAIIYHLLKMNEYDAAIGVKNANINDRNYMEIYSEAEKAITFQKSKYTMASYENIIKYIEKNRDKKVIIVGTGCVINSIQKWMKMNKIDLKQYLFIGLFCDKTLQHNIIEYFKNYNLLLKKKFCEVIYRTKEGSFWPGDVKLVYKNGSVIVPREERMYVTDYFQNQRCLYCLNHMNVQADLSIGDNYTRRNYQKSGSNSIVVRTAKGEEILNKLSDVMVLKPVSDIEIVRGQNLKNKKKNYIFSKILYQNTGIDINGNLIYTSGSKLKQEYEKKLFGVNCGKKYMDHPLLWNMYYMMKGKSNVKNRITLRSKMKNK